MKFTLKSEIFTDDQAAKMAEALDAAGISVETDYDCESDRPQSYKAKSTNGQTLFFAMRGTSNYLVRKPANLFN